MHWCIAKATSGLAGVMYRCREGGHVWMSQGLVTSGSQKG